MRCVCHACIMHTSRTHNAHSNLQSYNFYCNDRQKITNSFTFIQFRFVLFLFFPYLCTVNGFHRGWSKREFGGEIKTLRIRNSTRCCNSRPVLSARYWQTRVYTTKTTDRKIGTAKGLGRCGKRDKSEDLPLRASHRRCYAICTREYRANQTNGKGGRCSQSRF